MSYYLYILRCGDGTLYTGITTDVDRRVSEHNGDGAGLGAKYTRARRPVRLECVVDCKDRSEASKEESLVKKLTREQKEEYILRARDGKTA
jgi:putative endonuclease